MTDATTLDVRLHSPIPDVVVIRVSGSLDEVGGPTLARRVGQQLGRAPHVVIDLQDVESLCAPFLHLLWAVHRKAAAAGTQLHVSAEHDDVVRSLQHSGLDRIVPVRPAAEMVVAGLAAPHLPAQPGSAQPRSAPSAP